MAIMQLIERAPSAAELPLFGAAVDVPMFRQSRSAKAFLRHILLNPFVRSILDGLPGLSVQAWLTSGCLVQTVWNLKSKRCSYRGIDDYDLIYFAPDVSWESENAIIEETAALFGSLPVPVQIRNQARVPLWYKQKFLIGYPPVRTAEHAVLRFPARTTAIAVSRTAAGDYLFYAPFGFRDALRGQVRPNRRLPLEAVYRSKTERWQREWPLLTIEPWNAEGEGASGPATTRRHDGP